MDNYLDFSFIHVAVGVIINIEKNFLIARRESHPNQVDLWEFPGGKFEKQETAFEALVRELHEELGIVVTDAAPLIQIKHHYNNKGVLLDVWRVLKYEGEPYGKEGQLVQWVTRGELSKYRFPEANQAILAAL